MRMSPKKINATPKIWFDGATSPTFKGSLKRWPSSRDNSRQKHRTKPASKNTPQRQRSLEPATATHSESAMKYSKTSPTRQRVNHRNSIQIDNCGMPASRLHTVPAPGIIQNRQTGHHTIRFRQVFPGKVSSRLHPNRFHSTLLRLVCAPQATVHKQRINSA
jgi:hypothetical protein